MELGLVKGNRKDEGYNKKKQEKSNELKSHRVKEMLIYTVLNMLES